MQIETFTHALDGTWSKPLPAHLDSPQTLVLAFGAPSYGIDSRQALQQLRDAFPNAVLTGCSTAGEIFEGAVYDDTLSVAVVRFDRTRIKRALTSLSDPADSLEAGKKLAQQLASAELRAVFVLSDGLLVNGTALVRGLSEHLPPGTPISGGLAGDGSRFARTWVLEGSEPRAGAVCAVGLYGSALRVGLASGGGWSAFGPERRITRASGRVLYELDGQPALDLYKSYLGKLASELPGAALRFPLSVKQTSDSQEPLVRTILGMDESDRSLTFAGDIPQGGTAQLMRASNLHLVEGAAEAIALAAESTASSSSPLMVLSVSCVGRRMMLGEGTEEELESTLTLPRLGGHVGFYSYGEIAPVMGCDSRLLNQTMTVTVLAEDLR